MIEVTMYSTTICPYCSRAEMLLKQRGVTAVKNIKVDKDPEQHAIMIQRTGRRTVPQIFIGEQHIGGCDDLFALDRAGGLKPLLEV